MNETPVAEGTISGVTVSVDGNDGSADLTGKFSDPDGDTLNYTVSSSTVSVATASVSDSTVTITPVAAGSATVTVTASDGSFSAAQDISVTVKPNTAPAFTSSASVNVAENSTPVITVAASDSESEDSINGYSVSGGADSGKFSLDSSSGDLSFSSAPDYESPGSSNSSNVYEVTVQVSSGSGDRVKTATQNITVTVTDVNETPVAVGMISGATVNEDGNSGSVNVASKFSDPDGDTLSYTVTSSTVNVATVSVSGSTVTITPVAAGTATASVTASDGSFSATQDISVTVKPNTAPTFTSSASVNVAENATPVITVTASDSESEDGINGYSISGGADSGKFSVDASSGDLSFRSAPNFESPGSAAGTNVYAVTMKVSSGGGDRVKTATQTLTVTVTDVNEAPVAEGTIPAEILSEDGSSSSVDVSSKFSDPDGDTLSYTVSSSTVYVATASLSDSTVTITPVAAGTATVTVTASDGSLSAAQAISVTVLANTKSRFIGVATFSVPENTTTVGTITASDSDDSVNGYSISGGADSGKFSLDASSGALSFSAAPDYESPGSSNSSNVYEVAVQVSSGGKDRLKTATRDITVTVTDVNEAPEAVGAISAATVNEGGNSGSVDVSGNFSDPDGDVLSYVASSSAASVATASVSGSSVTIAPVSAGSAVVTVTASDPGNLNATQTIAVTVMANSAPAFGSSANLSVPENTTAVTTLTAADSEDSINGYSISGGADSGKFSLDASSGALSFSSAPDYESPGSSNGSNVYTVTVQASSGSGDRAKTATQTLTVPVTDVNEAPYAVGSISAVTVNEDGNSSSVDVSNYFSDPDGDTLSYTASSSAASVATATVSNSTVTISPVTAGSATVTVTASDGSLSAAQTISVTVNANSAPAFSSPASVNVPENTTTVITVTASDNDDSISGYSISGGADSGKFSIASSSGVLSFSSAPNFESPGSAAGTNVYKVTVQVESGTGNRAKTATQDITVTVTDVNEAPVAVGAISGVTLNEGGNSRSVDVSSNFSDPDGDALSYMVSSSTVSVATATVSNSTVTISPVTAGSATVTVTASDGSLSAAQTISVTVNANSVPAFSSPASVNVLENNTTVITVTASDNDDSISGYSISGGADSGKFSIGLSSGALSFSSAPNFESPSSVAGTNVYKVTVQVESGTGSRAKTATQNITVTVTDVNEAPVAVGAISAVTLNEGGNSRSIDVSSNFSDPDGDTLSYTVSSSTVSVATVSMSGSTVMISPVAAGGAIVTVTASDGNLSAAQTISVTVRANNTLRFTGAATFSVPENTTTVGTITATDSDDSINGYSISGGADSGKFSIVASTGDLSFSFAPNYEAPADASSNNDYIVEVQVSSGSGDRAKTATQTLTVTVTDVNEAPVAVGAISGVIVNEGGSSRSVDVLGNFSDPDGDTLSYTVSSNTPSAATASVSGSTVMISPVAAGGAIVNVTASDPDGLTATQTINVTVRANNTLGFIGAATFSVPENTTSVGKITATDSDDSVNGYSISGGADSGQFFIGSSSGVLSFNSAPNYEAPADASGNNDYVIEVQASSGSGDRAKTATQTLTVTVTDVNEAPYAVGTISGVTVNVDGSARSVDVSGNFSDPDGDSLSYTVSSSAASVATATVSNSTVTIAPVTAGSATVTVTASDGNLTATQTISVTVRANSAPTFSSSASVSVAENTTTVITVTASDSDDSVNGYSISGGADSGKFSIGSSSGALSFNTTPNFESPGSAAGTNVYAVEVQVSSGSGDRAKTAAQTLTVTVTDVNEAPVAVGTISGVTVYVDGSSRSVDVSGNFSDPDGDTLSYTALSSAASLATTNMTGSTVTIGPVAAGTATVTVTASDGSLSAAQTIAVTVKAASNQAPIIAKQIASVTLTDGSSTTVDVSDNFSDPNGDGLTYTVGSSDTGVATVSVSGDSITITSVGEGTATITVTATDSDGLTVSQTFTVTVEPVPNSSPVVKTSIKPVTLTDGSSTTVDVSDNFSDPDGDDLTYTAVSSDTGVVTVSVSGGSITITSVGEGTATITVTATDSNGLTVTETFTVTVEPVPNRSPVVKTSIKPVTLTDGSSTTVDVSDNFSDPDGDDLTYTAVSSDTGVATVSVSGGSITITSVGEGTATITVTATDSDGLTVTMDFDVTIVQVNTARYRTELLPNYPNPFNPDTWIPYRLGESANVTVTIYDVSGRIIRILEIGFKEAGDYTDRGKAAHWDGRNNLGELVAAGVYFYNFTTSKYSATLQASVIY